MVKSRGGKVELLPALSANGETQTKPTARVLLDEAYTVDTLKVSPDGKWVAYMSLQSGGPELWLATFPWFTERRKVSVAEGTEPIWRADGQEIVFVDSSSSLARIPVHKGATTTFGPPEPLMRVPAFRHNSTQQHYYGMTADGKRFLVRESTGTDASDPLNVIVNWQSLLAPGRN